MRTTIRIHPNAPLILSVLLLAGITFSVVTIATASAPNPGHTWSEMGDVAVTVAQGGTGLATVAAGSVLAANTVDTVSAITSTTGLKVLQVSGTTISWAATTGTGNVVFSASPTLSAPTLGTATATTVNGLTLTANGTGFSVAGGTTSKTLTLTGDATISGTPITNPMTTLGDLIYGGSSGTPTRLADVAIGSYLTSGGVGAAPAWASGRLFIGTQTKVAGNTTYVPTTGTTAVFIQMCGAGGGGAGANAAGTVNASVGAGGGAGGYLEKLVTFSTTAASYTINVPSGGGGGVGVAAGTTPGSNTTFACDANCSSGAVTFTANSGVGAASPRAAGTSVLPSDPGAGGAISTNGDVNSKGAPGMPGFRFSATVWDSGAGGPSAIGGGGDVVTTTTGGVNGGLCAGGSGAASHTNGNQTGGSGGDGRIIIWEYR